MSLTHDPNQYHTVPCGLENIVAHPNIQTVLLWAADNHHKAVALTMEFVARWCVHRNATGRSLTLLDGAIIGAITKFVCAVDDKEKHSKTFQDFDEMKLVKARVRASIQQQDLPVKLFNSIVLHSAELIKTALDNNIVAQLKKTVANLLRLYVTSYRFTSDDKATNKLVYATLSHVLASQDDYDSQTFIPDDERLWNTIRAEPWLANLRNAAAEGFIGYSDTKPIVYFVKTKPQVYLAAMITMNNLIKHHPLAREKNITPTQVFPMTTSLIPDFFRLDYHGLRDILMHACPDVIPRTGPNAECRNTRATATEAMRLFVWSAAFRTDARVFRPARSGTKWHVFGKSIQTDGVSARIQQLECTEKPEHVPCVPHSRTNYERINLSSASIDKQNKAQRFARDMTQAQFFVEHEPPHPDGITGATCPKTRAADCAKKWRLRAQAFRDTDPDEFARCLDVERRWCQIRDEAAAIFDAEKALKELCPCWNSATCSEYTLAQVALIRKSWEMKVKKFGLDEINKTQVGLWKSREKALVGKKPKALLPQPRCSFAKRQKTGVSDTATTTSAEFQYVDQLQGMAAHGILGEGMRLVGVDPNKGVLMQCCEVSDWVTNPELAGKKSKTTWFRHTQNERRFDKKTRYLAQRRETVIATAKDSRGLDVKAIEATLRLVDSCSVDPAGLDAYLEAKHHANSAVRCVYEDPVFRQLRWQGFRASQRADTNLVRRFRETFGGPETTALCWGDWSERGREGSGHMRFHEPTRGVGLRRLFRKHGYHVWMVDEDMTSKRCHGCQTGECATFRVVANPRPPRRGRAPTIIRWGLTRCSHCPRLWDRDVNSALNILWIAVRWLVWGLGRPSSLISARQNPHTHQHPHHSHHSPHSVSLGLSV